MQQAEEEEEVVDIFWHLTDHVGLEPVPQAQEVIRSPANDERRHYQNGHGESLHAGLGDVVILASGKTWGRNLKKVNAMRCKKSCIKMPVRLD